MAAGIAAVAALSLALVLGLLFGSPIGAGDNGDGARLYCGAGLVPDTPSHSASWQGGVVLDFVRATPCRDPQPSSAAVLFRSVAGGHGPFSLTKLGWLYVLLIFLATLLAAWALQARGRWRALLVLPPLVPLLEPDFARMFISTFGKPAGLLGAYLMLCGVAVIAVTRVEDGFERLSALVLVGGGGVVAGLAKIGFLPLFVLAVLVCAGTGARLGPGRWWSGRLVGPALAVLLAVEIIGPVRAALGWQDRHFAVVNAVNVVYTLDLVEMPGTAPDLGLPAQAQAGAGRGFFSPGPGGLIGVDVVRHDPAGIKERVWGGLLERPAVLARVVGIALQSSNGRALEYLPHAPWTPASAPPTYVDAGNQQEAFQLWLDEMSLPWWPSLAVLLGVAAGVVASLPRRRWKTRYGLVAGVAAVGALGIAVLAVLGDGYFEIAKHTWLAGYLLDTAALSIGVVVVPALVRWVRLRRAGRARAGSDVDRTGTVSTR